MKNIPATRRYISGGQKLYQLVSLVNGQSKST